jgi:hypothetical protein
MLHVPHMLPLMLATLMHGAASNALQLDGKICANIKLCLALLTLLKNIN